MDEGALTFFEEVEASMASRHNAEVGAKKRNIFDQVTATLSTFLGQAITDGDPHRMQ